MTRPFVVALAAALALSFSMPVLADPPPWAPAHGYRAKHKQKGRDRGPQVVYQVPAVGIPQGTCNRELLGSLLGGAAGGYAGSNVGSGSGRLAATAAGAVIGWIVGGSIGRSMDRLDHACIGQVLEQAETGRPVQWADPDTGSQYRVVPTKTFQRDERYCREYTAAVTVAGQQQDIHGIACRQPDGAWKLES